MNLKKSTILIHLLILLYFYTVDWLSEPQSMWFLINSLSLTFLFYLNYFVLGKWLLKKPGIWRILVWSTVNILIGSIFFIVIGLLNFEGEFPPILELLLDCLAESVNGFKHFGPVCLVAIVHRYWFLNRSKNRELESVKISHQIQELKNGFSIDLVNKMLTKMEERAKERPTSIEAEVLMLSNLLRYKLYESSASKIKIKNEFNATTDQIMLHNSLFETNFKLINKLTSSIEIKTGKLLNTVDDLLKRYPDADLKLELIETNNSCVLKAKSDSTNIQETIHLN
jgi:hypothetical protein